ncbi:HAD domain-containing protein [Hamadaea sp. NPDC050747]|uniref:HAD domain-containing protein n=1 Tax=Hamadaea sp. NPDC050747 TaxID=3155789 RepID=UPI0033D070BD
MPRPMLLLDVDGVLNPYAAVSCPAGFGEYAFFPAEEPVRLCEGHASWLADLGEAYELIWATGWGVNANRLLAPLLGLAQLPVIQFPPAPFRPEDKVPAIAAYAEGRPAVWIDDMLTAEAYAWADRRAEPTLLIAADPAEGLTRAMVDEALSWAATLDGGPVRPRRRLALHRHLRRLRTR